MGYTKPSEMSLTIYENLRRLITVSFLLVAILALSLLNWRPAAAISGKKYDAISQNCTTIKQSLRQLQKTDSRTRSYLGSTYETIATKFIVPLNLRLVKNGRPDTDLTEIQSDFTYSHGQFKEKYTEYMKELETLIGMECGRYPDAFYGQLEKVRESRAKLQKTVNSLTKLSAAQAEAVATLRRSL